MAEIDFLSADSFRISKALIGSKRHLREIAERTRLAPSTVHKALSALVSRKMVNVEQKKNMKVFSHNYDSPLTREMVKTQFIAEITSTRAFGKLRSMKPLGIYLFGSAASGRLTGDSDIDLAVRFESKPDSMSISEIRRRLSSELKMEIQLVVLTRNRIDSMEKGNTELFKQIKNRSIILEGEEIE